MTHINHSYSHHYEDWTESQRVALAGQRQSLLMALGYYFFERKKYEVSLEYWRKIIKTDACCEEAYLGVMLCSIALERTGDAVKSYHACAQKMREELHLSPSPKLVEIYLKMTSGAPVELVLQPVF